MTDIDVCDAIAERIAALWPERVLYRDFCPAGHARPSGYLYITKAGYTSLNALLVRWEMDAELELFCAADAYDISSTEELRREQARVLEAFPPPLPVGDRRVSLSAAGDGMELGSAYVKFSASWVDARPAGVPGGPGGGGAGGGGTGGEEAEIPKMEHFTWNHAGGPAKGKDEEA